MPTTPYTVSFHGRVFEEAALRDSIGLAARDLGLSDDALTFLSEECWDDRDPRAPHIVLFFGYQNLDARNHPAIDEAIADSILIIPIARSLVGFETKVPPSLKGINGFAFEDTRFNQCSHLGHF